MKRNSSFHRAQPRGSAKRLRPNLLDLEKPARGDRPALYWSSLVAAIVFHGGLLSYLIGHERLPADHAAADPAVTGGQAAQPLAKRDREGPAAGAPSFTREEMVARVAASSDDERLRAPPPDAEEIYVTVPVWVQPVAAERPKQPAKASGMRVAMEAAEEKTSMRNADPRLAEAPMPEGDREPEPMAQTPVPVPDGPLPEDRGAAGIVSVPSSDPAPPQQAESAPQTETAPPAEEAPATVAADSPDMPAPEAGPASVTDEKAQTSEQAVSEANPVPVPAAAAEPVPEPAPPAETREVTNPQQPLPEDRGAAIVALPDGPDPVPEPEPAAQAHHPLPDVAALSAPVDAPDMPLPRRRPAIAKAAADAQTGGTTSATATGEEKGEEKTGDAVESYRQKVRERLAEFRPSAAAASGTVVVSFTLSKSGAVSSAKILQSSGEAELDESVLAAVRRAAPFPKTPPGTRATQRRFVIPFLFRS